jgi:magnesium chelatase family protein
VLFIDEATEASARTLDALRQPLEQGRIDIHRAGFSASYPARFQLVLAMNPCPCGEFGVKGGDCVCPPAVVRRYGQRLSGPLLDRIDIELRLERVARLAGRGDRAQMTTAVARERVVSARQRAAHRLRDTPWRSNAEAAGAWLRRRDNAAEPAALRTLDGALQRGLLTLRGYDRVLRLAWTLADLAGRARPDAVDVGRALFLKKGVAS